MNIKNSTGPSSDPCGTPLQTNLHDYLTVRIHKIRMWAIIPLLVVCPSRNNHCDCCRFSQSNMAFITDMWCGWSGHIRCSRANYVCLYRRVSFSTRTQVQSLTTVNQLRTDPYLSPSSVENPGHQKSVITLQNVQIKTRERGTIKFNFCRGCTGCDSNPQHFRSIQLTVSK